MINITNPDNQSNAPDRTENTPVSMIVFGGVWGRKCRAQ